MNYLYISISILVLLLDNILIYAWKTDPEFQSDISNVCNIQEFHSHEVLNDNEIDWNFPFIVRNFARNWSATAKWTLPLFLNHYGERQINYGSQYSIVNGGGSAELITTISRIVEKINATTDTEEDAFVFQPAILDDIPALRDDFEVPSYFQSWDYLEREEKGDLWHMLSLGPSRKGLPFHNHGRTWLAVIHGSKLWFFYPLGFGPNSKAQKHLSPYDWLQQVYPTLQNKSLPYIWNATCQLHESAEQESIIYRPFTCQQNAGDVIFVPSQWLHMTLNVGQCIAVGGQELLQDLERLNNAKDAYKIHRQDPTVLKDIGLAMMNMANSLHDEIRNNITNTMLVKGGVIYSMNRSQTNDLLQLYVNVSNDSTVIFSALDNNNQQGLPCDEQIVFSPNDTMIENNEILHIASTIAKSVDINVVVEEQHAPGHRQMCFIKGKIQSTAFEVQSNEFSTIIPHKSPSSGNDLAALLLSYMEKYHLPTGSIYRTPSAIAAVYDDAEKFLLQSLSIQYDQPDIVSIVCELYLRNEKWSKLMSFIEKIDNLYSQWQTSHVYTGLTLASLYHKIGSFAYSIKRYHHAASLLHKSIQASSQFLPAWYNLILVYIALNDMNTAYSLFHKVTSEFNDTPYQSTIEDLRAEINNYSRDEDSPNNL